jgi:hypothetical protein
LTLYGAVSKLVSMRRILLGVALIPAILISFIIFAATAHAATFSVNTTDDGNDLNPGDGICEITLGDGDCGLRAVIEETNALGGPNIANFNITGAGIHTFTPGSAYPNITQQLTLDASTQPGASCGTLAPNNLPVSSNTPHTLLIEIDGSGVPTSSNGIKFLDATSSNSIIRGFVINRFNNGTAINVDDTTPPDNVTIECNYIGTNVEGTSALANGTAISMTTTTNTQIHNNLLSGNAYVGIAGYNATSATINNNLIGTNSAGNAALPNFNGINLGSSDLVAIYNNVISGNTSNGIYLYNTTNAAVTGNIVGLSLSGLALGNGSDGIAMFGSANFTIGGVDATSRNVSSANGRSGLHIYSNCQVGQSIGSNTYGNYFGTNASGAVQAGFGNQGAGVEVNEYQGSCGTVARHQIGGDTAGQPNVMAGNTGQGLLIHQQNNQDVFSVANISNSIYGNGQFGIDLAADTDNNNGDADTDLGPNILNNYLMSLPTGGFANYYLNRPTITAVNSSNNQLTVNYNFDANQADESTLFQANVVGYRLDFYINDAGQDGAYAGYSQGKTHVGSFVVNGSEANATHVFTSPVTLSPGQTITATSTVLWKVISQDECNITSNYFGPGPPYSGCPV